MWLVNWIGEREKNLIVDGERMKKWDRDNYIINCKWIVIYIK